MSIIKKIVCMLLAVFSLVSVSCAAKAKVIPVINAQFGASQNWFKGNQGSFGGIARLDVLPAIQFSDTLSLLPAYYGNYKGTKDVLDIMNWGNVLYQESMAHTVSVRLVKKIGSFKIKPKVSYRAEFINDAINESWGKGLFDYTKADGGVEFEKKKNEGTLTTIRVGYDYYAIAFPNYDSVLAATAINPSIQISTEGLSDAGTKQLDFITNELYLQTEWRLADTLYARLNYTLSLKNFSDQKVEKVVNGIKQYPGEMRKDTVHYATLNLSKSCNENHSVILGIDYGFRDYISNQNRYDAGQLGTFTEKYYDYNENIITPSCTMSFSKGSKLYIAYDIDIRQYSHRKAQEAVTGNYTSALTFTQSQGVTVTEMIPINDHFSLDGNVSYRNQISNMKYEQTYTYTFEVFSYFVGLSYKY